jgi:hypothetical protein
MKIVCCFVTALTLLFVTVPALFSQISYSNDFEGDASDDINTLDAQIAPEEGLEWSGASGLFNPNGKGQVEFEWEGNYYGAYYPLEAEPKGTIRVSAEVSLPGGVGWFGMGFSNNNHFQRNDLHGPWVVVMSDEAKVPGRGTLFAGPGAEDGIEIRSDQWKIGEFNTIAVEIQFDDNETPVARCLVNGQVVGEKLMPGLKKVPAFIFMGGQKLTPAAAIDSIVLEVEQ